MEIYLIRHTAVDNPAKLCYGQSDIPLADDWKSSFDLLKNKLGEIPPSSVFYSSPFKRCIQLAEFLSGDQYLIDPRIAEMHFGNWEQHAWTEIDQTDLNLWMANYVTYKVPGGENFEELFKRCAQFWDDLLSQNQSKIFIITHGGVIRSILAHVLNIPLDKIFQLEIDYSSVTRITVNKQYGNYQQVAYINR
jgi:alpha-ribazole phosphatase